MNLKTIVNQPAILFDMETDGLNLQFSTPWQVSWLMLNKGKIEREEDRFPWYPDIRVREEAARVNRFNYSDYRKKAEPKENVCRDFERDRKGRWLIGHNIINFDVYMLNKLRRDCGLEEDYSFMDRILDTRALAMAIQLGKTKIDYENFTAWQYSMISVRQRGLKSSLGFLLKELAIPHDANRLHDGLYDIQMNAQLLWQIATKFE